MINPSDILQLCRLCLVEDAVNHSIFEESGELRSIFLKISSCLPVSIHKDDGLPEKICDTCSTKLDSFYQFWNETVTAEKQLLEWLSKNTKSKPNQQTDTSKKMETTEVKQEEIEATDPIDMSSDAKTYILQQQQLPYSSVPTDTVNTSESDEPTSKRPRRASAVRALEQMESEDEDDPDMTHDNYAKTESDDSDKEEEDEEDSNHQENPSTTSMEEQPGPSGIVKKRVVMDDTPYGISHATAMYIFKMIRHALKENPLATVRPKTEFMVTLWRIFSPDSMSLICGFYGISEENGWKAFARVIPMLYSKASEFIKWPTGGRADLVRRGFNQISGWAKCLGAMGYTSIHVQRQGHGLVEIQLVCDDNGIITHWECGYLIDRKGNYNYSELATILDDDNLCPDPCFVIGPSSVGTKGRVFTPFRNKSIKTKQHIDVNWALAKATKQVKMCIALFKGRMRSLLHVIPIENKVLLKQFIGVCVIIHNICIQREDNPRLKAHPDYVYKYGRYFSYDSIHNKTGTLERHPNKVMQHTYLAHV